LYVDHVALLRIFGRDRIDAGCPTPGDTGWITPAAPGDEGDVGERGALGPARSLTN
jgi:hypothetical protein